MHGSRASLTVGLISAFLGLLVGGTLGLLAGYFRGRFESLTMATVDVLLAFPPLVLALAIIGLAVTTDAGKNIGTWIAGLFTG